MKITSNVTYLQNLANSPSLVADKNTVNNSAPMRTEVAQPAQAVAGNGDFDATRVTQIRASIKAGNYKINAEKIADGLLASARDLINTKAP